MTMTDPRDRLIVALDVASVPEAEALIDRLGDAATFYKIGYRLAYAGGLALAERLVARGSKVFLDLKLHDIGNTVEEGVRAVSGIGATFLTVHAYPQTMRAAVRGRGEGLKILAVTVLTSYDDADAAEAGYAMPVAELVAKRAAQAAGIGIDGLVCSAAEAAGVRGIVGADRLIVTPGIRPAGTEAGDQKRVLQWLAVTGFFGAAFVGIELWEFSELIHEGAGPQRSGFLSAFFALVGTHGLHVSFGIVWLVVLMVQTSMKGLIPANKRRLMCLSMFWHFLDVVWIGVFTFVYLMGVLS